MEKLDREYLDFIKTLEELDKYWETTGGRPAIIEPSSIESQDEIEVNQIYIYCKILSIGVVVLGFIMYFFNIINNY